MTEETGNESLFALATTLAEEGLYAEATKVVQKALVDGQCSDAEALDLQVRIYTREGLGLQTESCWQRVQQLAGLDPAHDRALSRIRQSFLSRGSLFPLSFALAATALLALLLWQILCVNPAFDSRLASNETSLAALSEGLAEIKRSTQAVDQEHSQQITDLNTNLTTLGQQLSERFAELSMATGVVQEHAVAIARLNGKIETFERVLDQGLKSPFTRHSGLQAPEVRPSPTDRTAKVSPQLPRPASQITSPQGPIASSTMLGKPGADSLPSVPIKGSPTASLSTPALAPVSEAAVDVATISTEASKPGEMPQDTGKGLLTGDESSGNKFPELRQLAISMQQEIPPMKLSVLVYSEMPRNRMIVINGRTMREGDEIASGLKLEQIVPNGAIFRFRGLTFRKGIF